MSDLHAIADRVEIRYLDTTPLTGTAPDRSSHA